MQKTQRIGDVFTAESKMLRNKPQFRAEEYFKAEPVWTLAAPRSLYCRV